jgi:RluA family pseudouridine synthase
VSSAIKLSSPATREFWEIEVLHEDEHLLALNKPAGLAVSPDPAVPDKPSLLRLLHEAIAAGKPWAAERRLSYLMNSHRLDTHLTGVLLLAKSKAVLVQLANVFGSEKPVRQFTTLVRGQPAEDHWESNAGLSPHPTKPGVYRLDSHHGKRAKTVFQVKERFTRWTLIQCEPLTHRPDQVRVHLSCSGYPIVGDPLYSGKPLLLSSFKSGYRLKPDRTELPLLSRLALHAESINMDHPVTGRPLAITAPWPKDFSVAVKYLRRYASLTAPPEAEAI